MTLALCLNCGEVKFGALCPCPKCQVSSTGNMNLDIAFSDHHMPRETLEEFGAVVAAIHQASPDNGLCFWTFIRYVSLHHSSILGVNMEPTLQERYDALLRQTPLPSVTLRPLTPEAWIAGYNKDGT